MDGGGGVTWKAHSSKAGVGSSDESWVGVNQKGSLEDQSSMSCASKKRRRAVARKESTEVHDYVLPRIWRKINDKSLEDTVSPERGERFGCLRVKCEKKCDQEGFSIHSGGR